jgi:NADPH:quinone reductase
MAHTPSTPRSDLAWQQKRWPVIPDGVTDEQAAALPVPALTALGSLELMSVTKGQRLVVMGATGGVGGYAVQMARARDAHVVATVRGDSDEARRLD